MLLSKVVYHLHSWYTFYQMHSEFQVKRSMSRTDLNTFSSSSTLSKHNSTFPPFPHSLWLQRLIKLVNVPKRAMISVKDKQGQRCSPSAWATKHFHEGLKDLLLLMSCFLLQWLSSDTGDIREGNNIPLWCCIRGTAPELTHVFIDFRAKRWCDWLHFLHNK